MRVSSGAALNTRIINVVERRALAMHGLLFKDHLWVLRRGILDKREGQGLGDRQIALMRNRVEGKKRGDTREVGSGNCSRWGR